jgi:hypothetical protein
MKKLLFKWKMKYGEDNWRVRLVNWFIRGK